MGLLLQRSTIVLIRTFFSLVHNFNFVLEARPLFLLILSSRKITCTRNTLSCQMQLNKQLTQVTRCLWRVFPNVMMFWHQFPSLWNVSWHSKQWVNGIGDNIWGHIWLRLVILKDCLVHLFSDYFFVWRNLEQRTCSTLIGWQEGKKIRLVEIFIFQFSDSVLTYEV